MEGFFLNNSTVKLLSTSVQAVSQATIETLKTPLDTFNIIFSSALLTLMTDQTNLYACQKGELLNAIEKEISVVTAITLFSGYCKVPYHELYWAVSSDTHNEVVANAMSHNHFRKIFSCLHLANNAEINSDRL